MVHLSKFYRLQLGQVREEQREKSANSAAAGGETKGQNIDVGQ